MQKNASSPPFAGRLSRAAPLDEGDIPKWGNQRVLSLTKVDYLPKRPGQGAERAIVVARGELYNACGRRRHPQTGETNVC